MKKLTATAVPTRWGRLRSPAAFALYAVLIATLMGWLQPMELRLLDLRAALTRHDVDSDVVLVEIDAQSLQRLHSWPWPRRYHARLLDTLRGAGVKDIFYDVDFSAESDPEDDERLAAALASYGRDRIMLPAFVQPGSSLEKGKLVVSTPLPELRRHGSLVSVNLHPDNDGLVRRMTASWRMGDQTVVLAGARMAGLRDYPKTAVQVDYGIRPESIRRISFADILAGDFDPGQLRNKHIIVGATAIELGDRLPVPVYRSLPGAVVQALAYLTLREGGLHAAPYPVDLLLAVCLALAMGVVFKRASWHGALLHVSLMVIAFLAFAVYAYREWQLIAAAAPLVTQALLGYGFFLVARVEQQHLRLLIQAFDLRRKDKLMSGVVNHSIDAILTVAENGLIKSVNPAARSLFAVGGDALLGKSIRQLIVDVPMSAAAEADELPGFAGGTSERQARRPDGSLFPVELALSRMDLDDEVLYTVFVRDITERVRQRETLEFQATHDALTGLANRYLLNRRLQQLLHPEDAQRICLALLLVDLDKFKEINDALGHGVGDQVLVQVAERFSACVTDSMVLARIGGDEFAVMLPDSVDKQHGLHLAQTLLDALVAPFMVRDMALEIGASVGVAYCPDHAGDAAALLQNADTAMYAAKRAGTGISLYRSEFTRKNVLRMTISTSLRQAMANSQLSMYYQPKLDLATDRVASAEALLRWNHPQLSFISPDEIVDVAETTGLIWPLTEWTLRNAVNDVRTWRGLGYDLRVAVNLSARLLQDMHLIERITGCLRECGADPQCLTLEITESAIMSDPERALKNAKALRAAGIHLSIDDFGTGYSSLSYLRNLPASELKIDKSFVMDMLNEENDILIVKSTIELAHNLGLKVVAEGVESEEILQALRDLGCDVVQGYHISRPLAFDKMEHWLADHCGGSMKARAAR